MSQNDMSDDETGLQTPQIFLSATSQGSRNNSGTCKDNRICLYQPPGLQAMFSHTRHESVNF